MSSQTLAHMKKDVKAFSEDSGRRRREESAVQLRKTKKEESLNKKRNITLSAVEEAPEAGAVAAVPEELNIKLLPSYVEGEHCVHVLNGLGSGCGHVRIGCGECASVGLLLTIRATQLWWRESARKRRGETRSRRNTISILKSASAPRPLPPPRAATLCLPTNLQPRAPPTWRRRRWA